MEKYGFNKYYVTLQDGIIKDNPASYTNFYEFEVKVNDTEKEILRKLLNGNDIVRQYEFLYFVCAKMSDKKDIIKILGRIPK